MVAVSRPAATTSSQTIQDVSQLSGVVAHVGARLGGCGITEFVDLGFDH
jgi:hypothetical protein